MTDDELRKLLAEATKGPWRQHLVDDTTVLGEDGFEVCCTFPDGGKSDDIDFHSPVEIHEANARLIAAAPDLAAEVLRLREENARLRALVAELADDVESEVNYRLRDDHPVTVRRRENDLEIVREARAALGDAK